MYQKYSYLPFIHAISLMIFSIFQILYISKLILYVWIYLTKYLL